MRAFWFLLLVPFSAKAQNVTASFDPSNIGENPASAATREFGLISPFPSITETKQEIRDPYSQRPISWLRKIDIKRYELLFAGKGWRINPELYVSQNEAKVDILSTTGESQSDNSINLLNSQLNLGFSANRHFKFGLVLFYPNAKYSYSGSYQSDDYSSSERGIRTEKVLGTGLGSTIFIVDKLAIGGFYTLIRSKASVSGAFKPDDKPEETYSESLEQKHTKYGFGISYQLGDSKKGGARIEISHSKMLWDDDEEEYTSPLLKRMSNSQTQLALEASLWGLTGGLTYTRIYGRYVNYRYFLDSIVEEVGTSQEPVNSVGGFIGFASESGSSIGGFANYFKGDSKVNFLREDTTAAVTQYTVGVSYSYVF